MTNCWKLEASDPTSHARAGYLTTRKGVTLPTPLFQPVATAASLKTLDWRDVEQLGYNHVLMNTYHLVVRPGLAQFDASGGLKPFSGWNGSILTDSGGYQAHSLAAKASFKPDGIKFTDHVDGGKWHFTPEFVLRAQSIFGVDFAMVLDICTGLPAERKRVVRDMELTHSWARQQAEMWPEIRRGGEGGLGPQRLFGIVQGGLHEDLRSESIELVSSLGFDGVAVGGLAVGEERSELERLTAYCGPKLPADKVHYLMGIGDPADLLHAIAMGFDMFDCVQPTRMARHGTAYTRVGKLNLKRARFQGDDRPLCPGCRCRICRTYSRAYIRHLVMLKEHSYARLLTLHNLYFYRDLLRRARKRIIAGNYGKWWPRQYQSMDRVVPEGL